MVSGKTTGTPECVSGLSKQYAQKHSTSFSNNMNALRTAPKFCLGLAAGIAFVQNASQKPCTLFCPGKVVKLVPHVLTTKGGEWCLYSLGIKDAFLTVPQRDECYIVHEGSVFQVCKCLPGQRPAAQWWCEQISDDITAFGLQKSKVCPVLFGGEQMCMAVRVDDSMVTKSSALLPPACHGESTDYS